MTVLEEIALRQSILYGGLALAAVFALIYAAFFCWRADSWPKTAVKAVPMLAFAGAGVVNFAAWPVVVALFLSAVGDIALSRRGDRAFLLGLTAFALAHVVYAAHFVTLGAGFPPLLPALALIALALSTEAWLTPHAGGLRGPVRVYVLLIACMGLAALTLPEGRGLALLGAAAFIASDAILGLQRFRMGSRSRWQVPASVALWLLYVAGQAGILLGAGFGRPIFHL